MLATLPYCHCARDGHPPFKRFFSLDELLQLSEEWGQLIPYCHEPTAHPNFPEIYDPRIALDHGGYLVTNGYGLARRSDYLNLLARMREMGMHTLSLTLHGLREHHDWFVCREGAFDDILLASQRAKAEGFRVTWQIYVDRKGLEDIPPLVEFARQVCGEDPGSIGIPFHRVSRRLWRYERYRPTLQEILDRQLHQLPIDPRRNSLSNPEALTASTWLEKWRQLPDSDEFKHPFEPRCWPPQQSFECLVLLIQRNRKVYVDMMCAPPVLLGDLSEGKETILQRLEAIQPPQQVGIYPEEVHLYPSEQEQLHPAGFSLRYKMISRGYFK